MINNLSMDICLTKVMFIKPALLVFFSVLGRSLCGSGAHV